MGTTVDCSGLNCPMPIVKLSQAIRTLGAGDTLDIISTDPAFKPDVEAWCNKTGNTLVSFTDNDGKFVASIRKA